MAVDMAETRIIEITGATEKEVDEKSKKVAAEERAKKPNASVSIKEGFHNCGGGILLPSYRVIITS